MAGRGEQCRLGARECVPGRSGAGSHCAGCGGSGGESEVVGVLVRVVVRVVVGVILCWRALGDGGRVCVGG